jgi:hypothetical protein
MRQCRFDCVIGAAIEQVAALWQSDRDLYPMTISIRIQLIKKSSAAGGQLYFFQCQLYLTATFRPLLRPRTARVLTRIRTISKA